MLPTLLFPLLALLPALGVPAPGPPATLPAAVETAALARALDAVDARAIEADVHFLASDALGGRDTPSVGLEVAARYLRARLQRLGWEPGARGGWFHEYELAYDRIDDEASLVELRGPGGRRECRYGEEYFLGTSRAVADLRLEAAAVYCGTGSSDEVEGLDLAGGWALCVEDEDVHWRRRLGNCRDAGAAGIVVVPSPEGGEPFAERFDRVVRSTRAARVGWPSREEEGDEAPYPMIYVAVPGAEIARLGGIAGYLTDLAPGTELNLTVAENRERAGDGGRIRLENVCGYWPGTDAELADEVILVSAHYDHVGTSDGEIYNGADDNGSGTSALLALAEALAEYGPMRRSVMLIWVSGEEKGLLGSRAWAADPWLPDGGRPVANINIDMVGRNAPDYLLVTPTEALDEHYNGLTRLAEEHAPLEGFSSLGSADDYWRRSDHAMFAKLGIPVAFLFSDVHEDYHEPTDTPEKVDFDKIRRVARLVLRMLDGMQTDTLDL